MLVLRPKETMLFSNTQIFTATDGTDYYLCYQKDGRYLAVKTLPMRSYSMRATFSRGPFYELSWNERDNHHFIARPYDGYVDIDSDMVLVTTDDGHLLPLT